MKPLFIPGSSGNLFAVYYPPVNQAINRAIIHIPAFGEEMNKSRRMVALQARAFAGQGTAVLVLDLFGTGDSSGDFGEATWQIWLQDIATAVGWLKQQGAQKIDLWGLRTGALLAMDFASRGQCPIQRLIAWQPVLNGETFITQFLRLRVAAAMMDSNAPKEKTADLKRQLQEGQGIEVAGYLLNPELVVPLMALRAEQLAWQFAGDIVVFEVVPNADSPASLGNSQFLSTLQKQAINASLATVAGDAFWASQEICEVPDLITATSNVGQVN